jgi:hypothetical protein
VLVSGAAGLGGGMWLVVASYAAGMAVYSAGAWLTAAWIGHDITVRLARRRDYQMVNSARPGTPGR